MSDSSRPKSATEEETAAEARQAGDATDDAAADDESLAQSLDEFVQAVHSGDAERRRRWREAHPGLLDLAAQLDVLEELAPRVGPAANREADTIVQAADGGSSLQETAQGAFPERAFGKYELLDELGRGGMGVVFRARQTELGREVAVKMILSSQLASPDDVRRFHQEAKAAARLRHANIVGVHEAGQINGQHYFTMDFVSGASLAQLLEKGPVAPDSAARCVASVARAVDYLHAHHVVHRDLKPSNILLDDEGTPYVTDFGLAKVFEADSQQTRTGTIVGTPSYMSPEQAAGQIGDIGPRSDVYSLGAILYELLTGRPPFRERNPLDTLVQVLEGEPTLPSQLNRALPRELEVICLRCLEKNPAKRYSSAAELADDLERYLKGEPIEARPSGLVPLLRRWARRQPALVSRLGALAAAAGIVQVKYMINGDDLPYHLRVMQVFGAWALTSLVLQPLTLRPRTADIARMTWLLADVLLMTLMLVLVSDGSVGMLLIGYPLLVAASGLFFHVRYVWLTTLASLVSYAGFLIVCPEQAESPHYPVIFASALAVIGFVVAYQVYRVRVLSRYYETRRLSE